RFGPRIGNAHDRLLQVLIGVADGFQEGPRRRTVAPAQQDRAIALDVVGHTATHSTPSGAASRLSRGLYVAFQTRMSLAQETCARDAHRPEDKAESPLDLRTGDPV